ncbi:hypothetical protein PTTG_11648 [Puccinia triticina 1-1 BBBD Race 1]|uniref:Uncharacterized protein n=2 Tax=Puccinia triticina (isolate 1-1 / race 1 (BBBD)) TaxID=630390 RepID=A0A180GXH0_PUCT1|nr:hypothetical protein PTTG_11648 [Puccinia triticina 1-1 BBBD Race 1]
MASAGFSLSFLRAHTLATLKNVCTTKSRSSAPIIRTYSELSLCPLRMASTRFRLSFLGAHARQVNPAVSLSRTFQQFRKKSEATRTTPDSPELAERNRFLDLHADHKDATQLFGKLLDTAGLEKVREHNNQLASVFHYSDLSEGKQGIVSSLWRHFTEGRKECLDVLKEVLELTDEADGDQVNTLIRRAHFVRFPERDASTLTEDQMLAALDGSTASAGEKLKPADQIQWATDIVRQGFDAEYQRHNLIVAPTLEKLQRFAGQWKRDKYEAPYTLLIGPSMSGKTRLLKELAKHVCVAYICLRPLGSTGQPPRSELATHFFPNVKAGLDLEKHYSYLLAAILNTVSEFFSRPDIRARSLEDRLAAWFDYSFQMDKTPKAEYNANVEKEMKSIQAEGLAPMQFLGAAATRMSQSIELEGDRRLKMLLAIDEASNLDNQIDRELQIPYFCVFRRALSHIPVKLGFFGVFTDTTLRVANFKPALTQDSSLRCLALGVDLFPPIYQISSLDVFVPKAPSSWDELLSAERLFSYGSPFYGLYFKGVMRGVMKGVPGTAVESTSKIAEAKLVCSSQSVSTEAMELSSPQCFAILGSVIQTRVCSYLPINSELVASHAAHCMFISSDQEMVVDYPPQFIYALAANRILASDEAYWIKCINVLATAVNKRLVTVGDVGEMATRLILIRAMQKTKAIPCNATDSIPDGYSVRLADFLETLTGKDPYTMDFDCIAEGNKARLLKEGRIFFNHFTRFLHAQRQ